MSNKAIFVANTGFALFNFRLPLMKHLSRQGWNVVAVANDEADFKIMFAREGFRFINIFIDHKGKNPIFDSLFALRLTQIYKQESPKIVHHFTIKPVIFGTLAARFANVPAIVNSIPGLGYVFGTGGLLKKLVIMLYKVSLSGRPKVIFQNSDDYRLFISKGIIKKNQGYVILGSGVNTKEIFPTFKERKNSNINFVLVSRMLWSKGVAEFVRVAEGVKKNFPETRFVMAGGPSGGGAKENPEAIPKKWLNAVNKREHVRWVGRVPFDEVMHLLDRFDVFVLPSYYPEDIPRCLLEAAAKGKPIIATNMPGCREVVEDGVNGFLVPAKDVNALEECMLEFIRMPHLIRKMGEESRRRAEDLFDEEKLFTETVEVYRTAGCRQL